jgi:hypothetical protein
MRRRLALLTTLALALGAGVMAPPESAEARARLSVKAPDQGSLARGARVRVRLAGLRPGRYRILLRVHRGRRTTLAERFSVRVRSRARRTVRRRLRLRARRRLTGCATHRLSVTLQRGSRRLLRARVTLRRPARCRRGAGRRDGPPVAPGVSTANFERCDFLDASVCLHPFPNDHFTVAARTPTGRRVAFHRDSMPRNRSGRPVEPADYNRSDGFSPGTPIVTRVPGLDTPEAFRRTAPAPVDEPNRSLSAAAPIAVVNARTRRRHPVWAEIDSNPADPRERNLIIRPAVNFDEGGRYIVVLRRLKDRNGRTLPAGRAFRLYRDRIVTTDRKVEGRRRHMESLFSTLAKAKIARRDLYLAWDFTVASAPNITGRMLHIRDDAFRQLGDANLADLKVAGAAPQFTINPDLPDGEPTETDGVVNYTPEQDARLARTVRGRITLPCYLDQPGCPTGARFALDERGLPRRSDGNTAIYDFTCNIPRRALNAATGTLRAGLYGHGLFGGQGEIFQGQLKDLQQEHGFLFCAVDWNGMATKDIPNAATVLQDLSRFPTLVDHVEQGFLGFLYLGRAMIHPQGLSAHPAFRLGGRRVLDTSALYYDGNSQGGIYGGSLAAIAPDHQRAVLGVPGMNYSTLLSRSVDFDTYAEANVEGVDFPVGLYDNYPDEVQRPLIFGLIQMLWDRADPNGYAHHMTDDPLPNTPPHKVLLHVGFGDHQVADVSAEVEARTIGARVHAPGLHPSRPRFRDRPFPDRPRAPLFWGLPSLGGAGYAYDGSGLVFWDIGPPRDDGRGGRVGTPPPPAGNVAPREGQDPHEDPRRSPLARRQKSDFLRPGGVIRDVCGGPCYAGTWKGG